MRGPAAATGPARPAPRAGALLAALTAAAACAQSGEEQSLEVRASAYNSVHTQTQGNPRRTAWGDTLQPGMQAIAVSRDLIALGLRHEAEVEIEGLPGRWVVRDKMARRWKRKIDIYMGDDVEAARDWGVRTVTIRWRSAE